MVCMPYPSFSPIYEFKWYQWQITKIKLKDIIRLCASLWLACIHFILCLTWTCESYLREPIIVKLLKSEIWFDGRILALPVFISGKFYFKKGTLHSFTTPCVCPTKAICWSSWYKLYVYVPCCCIDFIKFCDPSEMSFISVWSRSRTLHKLNFYIGS